MQPRTFKILWRCCTSPELLIPELSDEKQKFLIFKISVKFSNAVLTDKTLMSCNGTLGNFFFITFRCTLGNFYGSFLISD